MSPTNALFRGPCPAQPLIESTLGEVWWPQSVLWVDFRHQQLWPLDNYTSAFGGLQRDYYSGPNYEVYRCGERTAWESEL